MYLNRTLSSQHHFFVYQLLLSSVLDAIEVFITEMGVTIYEVLLPFLGDYDDQ